MAAHALAWGCFAMKRSETMATILDGKSEMDHAPSFPWNLGKKGQGGFAAPWTVAISARAGVEESPDTTGQRAS